MSVNREQCFHCGLPNDQGDSYPVEINNEQQFMCCPGCQAVAESIINMGLTDYYQFREALPETSPRDMQSDLEQLSFYDHEKVQAKYSEQHSANERSISLMVSGIVCSACTWLIESRLSQVPGVLQITVNQSTQRAQLRWDPDKVSLSSILATINSLGYEAQPFDNKLREQHFIAEKKRYLQRLAVAGLGMMQVMMYSLGFYLDLNQEMSQNNWLLLRWVSLVISTPVVFYAASPFYLSAIKSLRNFAINMDVPVTIAIFAAWSASTYATLTAKGEVYFDSVSMFVFFLLTGRYLQMLALHKSGRTLERRVGSQPETALRVSDNGLETVLLEDVEPNDVLLVKPGSQIPCDGQLTDATAEVDESILTGEARPVIKHQGGQLAAGSVNLADSFHMQVTEKAANSTLANVIKLLQQARETKPGFQLLADKIASYFVIAILFLTVLTGIYWYYVAPDKIFATVLAVLVITCPCALSLATPVAVTTALGNLTERAILVNTSSALFNLRHITDVVFDKTGTLTTGRFEITNLINHSQLTDTEILNIIAALESRTSHPIASAFEEIQSDKQVQNSKILPGIGIQAEVESVLYTFGNIGALGETYKRTVDDEILQLYLVTQGDCLAEIHLATQVRPEAKAVVTHLQSSGLRVHLLSGDRLSTVMQVGEELDIDTNLVTAEATPEEKLDYIKHLQAKDAKVLMVGDGLNDSPSMAAAAVSIAMAKSTDVTKVNADMLLMNEDLNNVIIAHKFATKTLRIIRQNLTWAASYNLFGVPLAMMGYVTPWLAALGMSLSSLIVVLNALRLSK